MILMWTKLERVPIEEDVVSSVELLSLVDDSNVVVVIADISVVNVD